MRLNISSRWQRWLLFGLALCYSGLVIGGMVIAQQIVWEDRGNTITIRQQPLVLTVVDLVATGDGGWKMPQDVVAGAVFRNRLPVTAEEYAIKDGVLRFHAPSIVGFPNSPGQESVILVYVNQAAVLGK